MIILGIILIALGVILIPCAAWLTHRGKKIWHTIMLTILAAILIAGGALSIGLAQLENMENYYATAYAYSYHSGQI